MLIKTLLLRTMLYTNDEIVEPFWAEYSSEASGRDPLAIQNSSVVIYTKMIVGITNVTNRIRYNGFYCWLLETILKSISKKNSLVEQIRYLRRSELLLAYVMVKEFPDVTGVSGSAPRLAQVSRFKEYSWQIYTIKSKKPARTLIIMLINKG